MEWRILTLGMKGNAGKYLELFKTAAIDWMNDHAPRLGAALAFYTIFSLAPLITILVSIAGLWFSENANQQMFAEIGRVMGEENAAKLQESLSQPGMQKSGIIATISAGVMLLFGATGVFVQLQDSLNEIWEVKAKPGNMPASERRADATRRDANCVTDAPMPDSVPDVQLRRYVISQAEGARC